jgi:hypothetical protein
MLFSRYQLRGGASRTLDKDIQNFQMMILLTAKIQQRTKFHISGGGTYNF